MTSSRIESAPYTAKEVTQIKNHQLAKEKRSAFPKKHTYAGYLFIRTDSNPQPRRKYFVLNNNFLLCGDNPYSERLAACIPLEGSNIQQTTKSSDMTFELTTSQQHNKKRKRKKYYFRADSPNICSRWTEYIERASTLSIKDIYRLRYKLGNSDSQSAKVIAAKHRVSNEEFAIKIIDKRKCNQQMLHREIQILKQLSNPYIVELCDLFETRKYLYIVMEFCRGGELFDKIANLDGDHYSEVDCCGIMHQLASGVQYMHKMGIVHRDLKPENILCVEDSIKKVKIADFGISANFGEQLIDDEEEEESAAAKKANRTMKTRVGTLSYTAPEILAHKPYDHRVDYWSLGVIMYILVCGYPPFDGDTDFDVSDSITNDKLEFEPEDWNHVSKATQTLVRNLLSKDPSKRTNCNDIIKTVWKLEISQTGFKKAHQQLKQTVFKRKFPGKTPSYDENDGSHHFSQKHKHNATMEMVKSAKKRKRKQPCHDDLSFRQAHNRKHSDLTQKVKAETQEKKYDSFQGKLGSKGTEHLFLEHMHPMNYRDSFVMNEIDEDWNQMVKSAQSKSADTPQTASSGDSHKPHKKKKVSKMRTLQEADHEGGDEHSRRHRHHHKKHEEKGHQPSALIV
eukprot:CAMPEP_0197025608 /NCGR_PEP_ID=MMETSP1384-20130603/5873_1 /TAXON_ID=29189 /ORGANISM="Ammonia sp." /LENGTH=622 /DNA_ID=CAMNT_0042454151 /DNA_START=11 /DNA_END=1879 /DNA_ORIENTATION=-